MMKDGGFGSLFASTEEERGGMCAKTVRAADGPGTKGADCGTTSGRCVWDRFGVRKQISRFIGPVS